MTSFQSAFARLDQFVRRKIKETRTSGIAAAVTDRKKLLGVRVYGFADVAARKPVTPKTLFEIGFNVFAIGKAPLRHS